MKKDCSTCKYRDVRIGRSECTRCHLKNWDELDKWEAPDTAATETVKEAQE